MKSKTYLLWILCGILSIGAGFVASQQFGDTPSFLVADDECDPDPCPDGDGGDDCDSMPTQIPA
jgi:hypothetical protein